MKVIPTECHVSRIMSYQISIKTDDLLLHINFIFFTCHFWAMCNIILCLGILSIHHLSRKKCWPVECHDNNFVEMNLER